MALTLAAATSVCVSAWSWAGKFSIARERFDVGGGIPELSMPVAYWKKFSQHTVPNIHEESNTAVSAIATDS